MAAHARLGAEAHPALTPMTKKSKCQWREDEDGNWETACGELFFFTEGGPAENGFLFCPYCGSNLKPVKWRLRK